MGVGLGGGHLDRAIALLPVPDLTTSGLIQTGNGVTVFGIIFIQRAEGVGGGDLNAALVGLHGTGVVGHRHFDIGVGDGVVTQGAHVARLDTFYFVNRAGRFVTDRVITQLGGIRAGSVLRIAIVVDLDVGAVIEGAGLGLVRIAHGDIRANAQHTLRIVMLGQPAGVLAGALGQHAAPLTAVPTGHIGGAVFVFSEVSNVFVGSIGIGGAILDLISLGDAKILVVALVAVAEGVRDITDIGLGITAAGGIDGEVVLLGAGTTNNGGLGTSVGRRRDSGLPVGGHRAGHVVEEQTFAGHFPRGLVDGDGIVAEDRIGGVCVLERGIAVRTADHRQNGGAEGGAQELGVGTHGSSFLHKG